MPLVDRMRSSLDRPLIVIIAALGLSAAVVTTATAAPQWTGAAGKVATTFDPRHRVTEEVGGLAASADGGVVAAGRVGRGKLGLVRYLPNGRLDSAFGDGGGVTFDGLESALGVLARPDGRITAAATARASVGTLPTVALVQVDGRGGRDTTFGAGDGRADLPLRESCTGCATIAATADGGTVVAGAIERRSADLRFAVVRVTAEGTVAARFMPFDVESTADSLAVQADGRIVVVGTLRMRPILARLTASGALDPSFGDGGVVRLPVALGAPLIDAAGRIVVSGPPDTPRRRGVRVVRYTATGGLDATFGRGGLTDLGRALIRPRPFGRPGGGTLVVDADSAKATMLRLTADGRLDTAFGRGGRVVTALGFGGGRFQRHRVTALGRFSFGAVGAVMRPDSSVVLGGLAAVRADNGPESDETSASELALAALSPNGHLDRRFGGRAALRLRVRLLPDHLKTVRRHGLRVRITPTRRGLVSVIAASRGRRIAAGMIPIFRVRRISARIPVTPTGRLLLRRAQRFTLLVTANDLAGNTQHSRSMAHAPAANAASSRSRPP
jgi:uncharacterized delta-60 repeat protein